MAEKGTAFVSADIRAFYEWNGAQAVTSALYHPATNGQAECYVAYVKKALPQDTTDPVQCRLSRILFQQHSTVHAGMGVTLAKAMFGRK